ncbi:helix-turn-helix domain-containing protein [Futiania mangrovi]|uniref:Helix-turn-helix domain-containing protein n=1 Tax=Futiania mangrovi TaxID=2959716 RepID=A0A9J6P7L8_9PROT|nr:helix-turn-helix transcriptional regulator [Futiania mangrovii]MCP1334828.1 helix-turn-helix domain-containing protein [Futiania mangrovii]
MKHHVDAHVGQRLRHRRWLAGMTQQQLGDAVGIKFQQIQKYETGMNRISASRLWDLAQALDVPVSFFFEGLDLEAAEAEGADKDVLKDKETMELLRAYYAIPDDQRRKLFDLAKAIGED